MGFAIAIAACVAILSLYIDMVRPNPGFEQVGRVASLAQSDGVRNRGLPYDAIERLSSKRSMQFGRPWARSRENMDDWSIGED